MLPVKILTHNLLNLYFPPGLSTRTTLKFNNNVLSTLSDFDVSTKSKAREPEKLVGFGPTRSWDGSAILPSRWSPTMGYCVETNFSAPRLSRSPRLLDVEVHEGLSLVDFHAGFDAQLRREDDLADAALAHA